MNEYLGAPLSDIPAIAAQNPHEAPPLSCPFCSSGAIPSWRYFTSRWSASDDRSLGGLSASSASCSTSASVRAVSR